MFTDYKLYEADTQQLIFGQISPNTVDDEFIEHFTQRRDIFLQIEPGSEVNIEMIRQILETFEEFLMRNSKEIVNNFDSQLCEQLLTFLNYDNVEYQKMIFNIIGTICMKDKDYISFFCDREIVDTVLTIYNKHTHDLFSKSSFLFSSLLPNCPSNLTFKILNDFLIPVLDYSYSILRGLELECENFRQSGIFFYFLLKNGFSLTQDNFDKIHEAIVWQINYMSEDPFPNNIFVFTLWDYFTLLYNNKLKLANLINSPYLNDKPPFFIIELLCRFFEDDYDLDPNASDTDESSPLNPLFAIFNFLFTLDHSRNEKFIQDLRESLYEKFSFSRLLQLTSSDINIYSIKAFELLKQILIKCPDLTPQLLSLGLFDALATGMENSFSIKEKCYETILSLIETQISEVVADIFKSNIFLLAIDYVSSLDLKPKERFLKQFKSGLEHISDLGINNEILMFLAENEYIEQLEDIFDEQDLNLIIPIQNLLGLSPPEPIASI